MNRLFPLPLYTFLKTVIKYGGISFKGLRNLPGWLLKTTLFEPLRWIDLTYNKRIEAHDLPEDPIFILGFYRSGTSFMHEFLSQDDRLGYHTNYQMILPEIMLSTEWILAPFFDAICRLFNLQDPVHRIQMSFKYPGEEDATMTTGLNPRGAQWGYFFPKIMMEHFRKYVLFEDLAPEEAKAWEEDFYFLIKKISFANNGRQLILKSPPNTARVERLLKLFPKAKFIMVHRNPYKVYASNKRFWKVTNRIYALGDATTVDNKEVILETYSAMMQRYLQEKDLIPEGQLIEVPYAQLVEQPLETMRTIYQSLHLPDFAERERAMRNYLDGQKDYVRLKHELPTEEKARVTQKFGPFLEHWGYALK